MVDRTGIAQRTLRRVRVLWGPQERRHEALIPVFDRGYKVLGLVGLDANGTLSWYPGVPLMVERGRLRFKSSLSDASPAWSEVPAGLLEGSCFLDSWGAIQALLPRQPGAPSLAGSLNLTGQRIRGRWIVDVVFEPGLHRVRAFVLAGRWGRGERIGVMRLPALAQSLRPARAEPLDATAIGPPPEWGPPPAPAPAQSQPERRSALDYLLRALMGALDQGGRAQR